MSTQEKVQLATQKLIYYVKVVAIGSIIGLKGEKVLVLWKIYELLFF